MFIPKVSLNYCIKWVFADQEEDHLIVDQLNLENRMDDKERLGHMNYIVVKQAGMDEEDDFVDITET